jgi:predicted transcriptional regulator
LIISSLTILDLNLRFIKHIIKNLRNENWKIYVICNKKTRSLIIRKEIIKKARASDVRTEKVEKPYRSKMMLCIEILCTLASRGPTNLTQLTYKVEMDKSPLIPLLRLIHNRGLVEKQNQGEQKIFYVVTERGLKVLKVLNPLIQEAHKIGLRNLEVISSTLS